MVASYVMIRALLTTAVEANAIFPPVVVVNIPVGIKVICPPVPEIGTGAVIVAIGVVPDTNAIAVEGAIVVADAIVGATTLVAVTPTMVGVVIVGEDPVISVPDVGRVTLVLPAAVNSIG